MAIVPTALLTEGGHKAVGRAVHHELRRFFEIGSELRIDRILFQRNLCALGLVNRGRTVRIFLGSVNEAEPANPPRV